MKLRINEIPKRFLVKPWKMDGVQSYGIDNCYPQSTRLLINSSGRGRAVVNTYSAFIEGNGFNNTDLWKLKVNTDIPHALTMDALLRNVAEDFGYNHGFAIHVNWNANFKWTDLHFVPFEYCRLGLPDSANNPAKVMLYSNWDRTKSRVIKRADIQEIDFWNPDPQAIQSQVDAAGGWDKYKGQIYWYSKDGRFTYPMCSLESVIEDVDSDSQAKIYKNNNIRTDFLAPGMLIHPKSEENAGTRRDRISPTFGNEGGSDLLGWDSIWDENSFSDKFRQFQGADNASRLMDVEADVAEVDKIFKYIQFDTKIKDNLFKYTEDSIQANIRKCLLVPSLLLSDEYTNGKLSAPEIDDSVNFYNGITKKLRRIFEEIFTDIFSYTSLQGDFSDFTIQPVSILTNDSSNLLEIVGAKGIASIQAYIQDPPPPAIPLTSEQKINALIILFGLTQEDADSIVNGTPIKSAA